MSEALDLFHPAISHWFRSKLGEPTVIQAQAWSAIRHEAHVLIAAPTGSGKTLAAFLNALDELWTLADEGLLADQTQVLYVSPLKALSNDVEKNLTRPLTEIREAHFQATVRDLKVRVGLRTGDTSQAERQAMLKQPPHILITTPESLYLLLTARRGRDLLKNVRTVIIDEVHALVSDRRGAHLLLSLQRLEALCDRPLRRIGLSATQKPIEGVARMLVGHSPNGEPKPCTILDAGLRRNMDLAVVLPDSPLQAIMPLEVWEEVYAKLEGLIHAHRSVLLFVNTRRLAERVAHRLSQTFGEEFVAAHHGSLSRERRFKAETALKAGRLKVMVATASLELGIDIGDVDLAIQLGTPKSISSFVQRMGRASHFIGGTPKGRIFPLTRDELVEAAALMRSVKKGDLDTLLFPRAPLDVLSQQIVAEVACREWSLDGLYALFSGASPYAELTRKSFDEVIDMLGKGFSTRRGRQGAWLHVDTVNGRVRGRRGARLAAITCGGAIPDSFDYDVRMEPGDLVVGSVNEDFAIESMPGDIFQLGNRSWRILRVEASSVRVSDAGDQPPTIPFWIGEAPGRSHEFSASVSSLREDLENEFIGAERLKADIEMQGDGVGAPWKQRALAWMLRETGIEGSAAEQLIDYLASALLALGHLPTLNRLVMERFFDEGGDMHLVIHSPFGSRLNRAYGLSLRKRFCRKFNYELQAAATEESVILSLGATHSFPLEEVWHYLHSETVRPILIQALLAAPMFEVRWRWNASRALAVLRQRAGKRTPPPIQRLQAQDLAAQVFPDSIACPENLPGDRELPDHPLVNQTLDDCLYEAMDIEALETLLRRMQQGHIALHALEVREPSPLAEEIIGARPYAFLDDAPLEERRTRTVRTRQDWSPASSTALNSLAPEAMDQVIREATPQWRDADELHDTLLIAGFLTEAEVGSHAFTDALTPPPGPGDEISLVETRRWMGQLIREKRVGWVLPPGSPYHLWFASERFAEAVAIWGLTGHLSNINDTVTSELPPLEPETAWKEWVRGRLEIAGPIGLSPLAQLSGIPESNWMQGLLALEAEGFVFRGTFPAAQGREAEERWCERRLLARIHRLSRTRQHQAVQPIPASAFQKFLFDWQHLEADAKVTGPEGVAQVLRQLAGRDAPLEAWEKHILPARVDGFQSEWLDQLCLAGRFHWRRSPPFLLATALPHRPTFHKGLGIRFLPSDQTVTHTDFFSQETHPLTGYGAQIVEWLQQKGACFWREIARGTGLLEDSAREGLKEAVAQGLVACDGLSGLRALLRAPNTHSNWGPKIEVMDRAGRWFLVHPAQLPPVRSKGEEQLHRENRAHFEAQQLLTLYGVAFRKLWERESEFLPWREILRVLRLMEDRGEVRGGRFIAGFSGEQFALPQINDKMRQSEHLDRKGGLRILSAIDPTNLQGILSPGPRIPGTWRNQILFEGGKAVAALEGGQFQALLQASPENVEIWREKFSLPSIQTV